jgi:hypothetical protein
MDPEIRASKETPPMVPPAMAPVLPLELAVVLLAKFVLAEVEEVVAGLNDQQRFEIKYDSETGLLSYRS